MVIVGIAGGTCSGKTTLADRVGRRLGGQCAILPLDNYYRMTDLPFEKRAKLNHDLPQAIDWPLLREHVSQLSTGQSVLMPIYSFRRHKRTEQSTEVAPAPLLIIEGIHAWHDPEIQRQTRLKIFMDSTAEQRRQRRLKRDLEERCPDIKLVIEKFEQQTEATFADFEQTYKSTADIVTTSIDDAEKHILEVIP